ncbi:hypothetical protein [Streptomyces bicolor]|uniref:hypothetical protein n=1 Tax=Streptomyces bicolor TaxID=66874 RepID=UPI0004E26FE0|nr:hypothetical protein [Streptomyces bicolor]
MGQWRLRRSLSGSATRYGFGEVRRVHRERRSALVLVIAKLGFDWAMVLFLIEALSELDFDPGVRPVAVFLWLVGSWGGFVYWLIGRAGSRWYAVCDGGLLVGGGGTETIAVAWDAVEGVGPVAGGEAGKGAWRLSWLDGGKQRYVTFRTVTDREALVQAVELREPVPTPPGRRVLAGAGLVTVAGVVVWAVALSSLGDVVMVSRPYYLRDFGRLCTHPGASYAKAAPYGGSGPHPVVLIDEEKGTDPVVTAPAGRSGEPDPDDVQLVVCSRIVRRELDLVCMYEGGEASLTFYRARYRIDVYEARTGRRITGHTVDADTVDSCPIWMSLNGRRGREERVAAPAQEEYQHIVDEVAVGSPS